jgi:hypothetical protein
VIDPRNPLSWPLFPILPLRRKGASPFEPGNLGFFGCRRQGLQVVPVVFVANLCDAAGRSLAELYDDARIRKEAFGSLDELLSSWDVD